MVGVFRWICFQGNQENRVSVYDKKVIDYINFILRAGDIADCPIEKVSANIQLFGSWSVPLTPYSKQVNIVLNVHRNQYNKRILC